MAFKVQTLVEECRAGVVQGGEASRRAGLHVAVGNGDHLPGWRYSALPGATDDKRCGLVDAWPVMFSLSPATRIFVALNPVDMRAGFNTLYSHVQTILAQNPLSGHLFCFTNRSRNRVKLIFFDGSGLWVCAKRLERGTFGWPSGEGTSCCLRPEELQLLLHGIEGTPRRHWYRV